MRSITAMPLTASVYSRLQRPASVSGTRSPEPLRTTRRGARAQLGQPVRAGELRWARLDAWLRPLIPANYRAIDAADVAAALRRQLPTAQGRVVLPSGAMQGASQTV